MLQQAVHNKQVQAQYRDARGRFARKADLLIPVPIPVTKTLKPQEKPNKIEQQKEQCRKFLHEVDKRPPGVCAFMYFGGKGHHRAMAGHCHAAFRDYDRDYNFLEFARHEVVVSYIRDNTEEAKAFNDYILSEDSPWSAIVTRCEIVRDENGKRLGFIIPPEVLKDTPQAFIFNFLIASRMTVEFPKNVHTWSELRKLGVSAPEAHLLCRLLRLENDHWNTDGYATINGWHWPFNHDYTNLKSFLNKDVRLDSHKLDEPSCNTWSKGGKSGLPRDMRATGIKQKEEGTKFSTVRYYELTDLVEWYNNFREKALA